MTFRLPETRLRPWSRSNTETMADYRIFRVDRIDLVDGAGNARRDAYVLACPDWCNIVPVTDDGHVVMIWQPRFGTDALSLEIPGGVIDAGEDALEGARRELQEETGYTSNRISLLGVVEPNPAMQGNRFHAYVAEGVQKTHDTEFDEHEECETVLVPIDAIAGLLDEGRIAHALVVVALEKFLRRRRR